MRRVAWDIHKCAGTDQLGLAIRGIGDVAFEHVPELILAAVRVQRYGHSRIGQPFNGPELAIGFRAQRFKDQQRVEMPERASFARVQTECLG
jgi:hypothetical protein